PAALARRRHAARDRALRPAVEPVLLPAAPRPGRPGRLRAPDAALSCARGRRGGRAALALESVAAGLPANPLGGPPGRSALLEPLGAGARARRAARGRTALQPAGG